MNDRFLYPIDRWQAWGRKKKKREKKMLHCTHCPQAFMFFFSWQIKLTLKSLSSFFFLKIFYSKLFYSFVCTHFLLIQLWSYFMAWSISIKINRYESQADFTRKDVITSVHGCLNQIKRIINQAKAQFYTYKPVYWGFAANLTESMQDFRAVRVKHSPASLLPG